MRIFPSSKRKSSYSFPLGSCHEFFSSSKRKSSQGEFPCGRGGGGGHQGEYLKMMFYWSFSEVLFVVKEEILIFLPPSTPPLPQGNYPREDFLFDEEKNSQQISRTASSFSLRQRGNPYEGKLLMGGGEWRRAMSFSLRQRGNPHEEKILVG